MCLDCKPELKKIYETYPNYTRDDIQTIILFDILHELKAMKKQEFDYWEAWKKAKNKENDKITSVNLSRFS